MTDEAPMPGERMEAAINVQPRTHPRGADLLIHHCLATGVGGSELRLPARARLEQILGGELSTLLVGALTPVVQGRRGSSSP